MADTTGELFQYLRKRQSLPTRYSPETKEVTGLPRKRMETANHITYNRLELRLAMERSVPKLAGAAGLLLCLALSGCGLAAFTGISPFAYPHFWDFTNATPTESEIAGKYVVLKISGSPPNFRKDSDIWIYLNTDHTASFSHIPEYDGVGEKLLCTKSASGTWKAREGEINFWPDKNASKTGVPECDDMNTPLTMLGHGAPYRLYLYVGDPDNDTGIEFRREK